MSKAHDSAIIEAAARALMTVSEFGHRGDAKKLARVVLTAVTPMILERAAKVADDYVTRREIDAGEDIAAAIRALITKDSGDGD